MRALTLQIQSLSLQRHQALLRGNFTASRTILSSPQGRTTPKPHETHWNSISSENNLAMLPQPISGEFHAAPTRRPSRPNPIFSPFNCLSERPILKLTFILLQEHSAVDVESDSSSVLPLTINPSVLSGTPSRASSNTISLGTVPTITVISSPSKDGLDSSMKEDESSDTDTLPTNLLDATHHDSPDHHEPLVEEPGDNMADCSEPDVVKQLEATSGSISNKRKQSISHSEGMMTSPASSSGNDLATQPPRKRRRHGLREPTPKPDVESGTLNYSETGEQCVTVSCES